MSPVMLRVRGVRIYTNYYIIYRVQCTKCRLLGKTKLNYTYYQKKTKTGWGNRGAEPWEMGYALFLVLLRRGRV